MKDNLEIDSIQPFFPLSYLKQTYAMSFKSTLSFSVHSHAGIMKKSSILKIIVISSLILQSQLTFSLY